MPLETALMDIVGITQRETSQSEKHCVISVICGIYKLKNETNKMKRKQIHEYRERVIGREEVAGKRRKISGLKCKIF